MKSLTREEIFRDKGISTAYANTGMNAQQLIAIVQATQKALEVKNKAEVGALKHDLQGYVNANTEMLNDMAELIQVCQLLIAHHNTADGSSMDGYFKAVHAAQLALAKHESSIPLAQDEPLENKTVGSLKAVASPMTKRRVFDAIRGAYDLGFEDARNAKSVPGDNAPGYKGREVEQDHGGALLHAITAIQPDRTTELQAQVKKLREALDTLGNNLGEFAGAMENMEKAKVLIDYANNAFTALADTKEA